MLHHQIDETEIMEQNLQKLIKNQNYFSCFIQSAKRQEEPTNPFQKKIFDKNLRRSAISCGHYGSVSHNQSSQFQQSNMLSSSRRNSFVHNPKANERPSQSNLFTTLMPPQRIQTAHKINLTLSRHSDPIKQQITQIVNNFRLELDYLEEKLQNKIDQLNYRYGDRECGQKDREAQFMIESLEKIVGFMIENCVNLEDSVMYGDNTGDNTQRSNEQIMRKEMYQIEEDENEQNMSFNPHQNTGNYFRPNHRFGKNINQEKQKPMNKKRKIVGFIEKENINSNLNHDEESLPQTYFINSKLHSTFEPKKTDTKTQTHTIRNSNDYSSKPTKRGPSKQSNQKIGHQNTQNESYHQHSSKDMVSHTNQAQSSFAESSHPSKSIYETVLQEREMRLKMKKKIV